MITHPHVPLHEPGPLDGANGINRTMEFVRQAQYTLNTTASTKAFCLT